MTGIIRLALLAACGVAVLGVAVNAQDTYPSRTVRFVVPFPAGSGTDVLSRLLADHLSRKWGRTVISENVPGASGNIGALDVWRAAPDGHTMLLAPPGPIATNRFLFKEMTYDSTKWVPVSWLTTVPYVLTVRNSFKGTLADLIAAAKAGKITAALPGPGGTAHLSAAHLQALAGVKMVYVPYKGLGPAMNDIVAGHVDMMFDTLTTSLPLHQQGRIRIIAVASPKRIAALPDVPTVAEFRLSDVSVDHLVRVGRSAGYAARDRRPDRQGRWRCDPKPAGHRAAQHHADGARRGDPRKGRRLLRRRGQVLGQIIKDTKIALQ